MFVQNTRNSLLALLFAVLLWALSYPLIKIGTLSLEPATLGFLRLLIAALFFAVVIVITRNVKNTAQLFLTNFNQVLIASIAGVLLYQLTENFGIKLTLASAAGALSGVYPLVGFILAVAFLKEVIKLRQMLGALVALLGIIFIFFGGQDLTTIFQSKFFLGNALILANVICFGVFSIYAKKLIEKHGALPVTALVHFLGALLLFPVFFFESPSTIFSLSPSAWVIVILLGVLCSAVAYLLWIYALKHVELSRASGFIYMVPVSAILFSYLLLGESITGYLAGGTALILTGVYLIEKH